MSHELDTIRLEPNYSAPSLPDTSRRARGQGNPRNIGQKLWTDKTEDATINELAEVYGTNKSAMIRWLIALGIERVNELANTDPIHESLHARGHSKMAS